MVNVSLGYDLTLQGNPCNGSRDRKNKYFSLRKCHIPKVNLIENPPGGGGGHTGSKVHRSACKET
jgi:hypothetical protein